MLQQLVNVADQKPGSKSSAASMRVNETLIASPVSLVNALLHAECCTLTAYYGCPQPGSGAKHNKGCTAVVPQWPSTAIQFRYLLTAKGPICRELPGVFAHAITTHRVHPSWGQDLVANVGEHIIRTLEGSCHAPGCSGTPKT